MKLPISLLVTLIALTIAGAIVFRTLPQESKRSDLKPSRVGVVGYTALGSDNAASNVRINAVEYQKEYLMCLETAIHYEGIRLKPYIDPAGYLTIGYGHKIKKGEKFGEISSWQAWELLKKDFGRCIERAVELGFEYPDNRQLAVAHAVYCLGIGTVTEFFHRHKDFSDIALYNKYWTPEGEWITAMSIQRSRDFEVKLFYSR